MSWCRNNFKIFIFSLIMNKIISKIFIGIFILIGLSGCIHNDLPYPKLQQNITKIKAIGENKTALIDSTNLTVTVYLGEDVDIENVSFEEFSVSEGGESVPDLATGTYNLSTPIVVDITLYQTYQWLVKAEQYIERYFTIEGQIGETVIDAVGRRIIVDVPETLDLSKLMITSIKLGPAGITTYTPSIGVGEFDFLQSL